MMPMSPKGQPTWRLPTRHVATVIAEPLNQRWVMTSYGCNIYCIFILASIILQELVWLPDLCLCLLLLLCFCNYLLIVCPSIFKKGTIKHLYIIKQFDNLRSIQRVIIIDFVSIKFGFKLKIGLFVWQACRNIGLVARQTANASFLY